MKTIKIIASALCVLFRLMAASRICFGQSSEFAAQTGHTAPVYSTVLAIDG